MKTFTNITGNSFLIMDYGKSSIPAKDIKYIRGDGNYSYFQLSEGRTFISSFTLKTFAQKLNEDDGFFSPCKGILINVRHADEIIMRGNSKFVKMVDGKELQISRRRGREFLEFIKNGGWDIGT